VDAVELLLRERRCDATNRLPTNAWPLFATTLEATIAAGATTATLTFKAKRDTLFNEMSMRSVNITGGAVAGGTVENEYCQVTYIDDTDIQEFRTCCDHRPFYVVGVTENKELEFNVTLAAVAPAGGVKIEINLSGIQGKGCCP